MKIKSFILFMSALLLSGASTANVGGSFQLATDNFYLSVGDYDYLPYTYAYQPATVTAGFDFHTMMAEYGVWLDLAPFGPVWRPYTAFGWRPYTFGHWLYTSFGPSWEGYEPWAWAAYHYGHWVFTEEDGWVWIPGDEWFACDVMWAEGPDCLGWMPLPPMGYGYVRGRLARVGGNWMAGFSNPGFDLEFGGPRGASFGPQPFFDPAHASFSVNLWTFIKPSHFSDGNYASAVLGSDFSRTAFDRRGLRFTSTSPSRKVMERITRSSIPETPVAVKQIRTSKSPLRVVVPTGTASLDQLRTWGPRVVRQIIAPAYAEKHLLLRGEKSKDQTALNRVFRQENVKPRAETRAAKARPGPSLNQLRQAAAAPERTRSNAKSLRQNASPQPREPVLILAPASSAPKHEKTPPNQAQINTRARTPHKGHPPASSEDAVVTARAQGLLRSRFPALANGSRVESSRGVVTLQGTARTAGERDLATRAVSSLAGVKKVNNRMTVQRAEKPHSNNRPEPRQQQPGR